MDVSIRPMRIRDFIDLYMRGQHINDHSIIERDNASPKLFAPDKLAM